ncbi:MAG: DNA polymerase III subunit alpha [Puniceicoccales bacterium]|jgi:DNA polymerase-3 subunit alpha|nr:DNA polymerase III subunit alpha [Puniceicoccales bacterium]
MSSESASPNPDFVHLHVHTDYSLLDGCSRIDRLMERTAALGMKAVAITDHGNLFGMFDFWSDAKKHKIKPLLGCEIYLVYDHSMRDRPDRKLDKRYHMGLLAKNFKGYQNLIKLVSDAHVLGMYYKPRTDMEQLAKHAEGLVGFTGCMQGVIPQALLADDWDTAQKALGRFLDIFGKENYFVEIMDHGIPEQAGLNQKLLKLAEDNELKVVCTNDVHYIDACHVPAHDALLCIQTGAKLTDEKRLRYSAQQFYLKTGAEMARIFGERPDSLSNTNLVAEMCDVQLPVGQNNYPVYRLDDTITINPDAKIDRILDSYVELKNRLLTAQGKEDKLISIDEDARAKMRKNGAYLLNLCKKGLQERYGVDYDDPASWADKEPRGVGLASPGELCERIDYELSIIAGTGFIDYFLIVWDFIAWARDHGIPVGPGRGSGAGSLIAYCLKITDIDPIRFNLLFERFLNPERVSAPDFDIDFCMRRRDDVVDYVRHKYGEDRVSNIITFGTFGAKMVVRDLARVMDVPFSESNRIAKLIPDDLNISLEDALKKSVELRDEVERNKTVASIMEQGEVIEGMVRNTGKHACGMIIADRPLTDIIPVTMQEGALTTQYAKDPVDKLGLLKMDFLGLKTLTVIDDAVQFVRKCRQMPEFDIEKIPFDDSKTFQLLNAGHTIAVFQLESEGMQNLCRQFSIATIDEIIALIALYRPGPMQFIPQYIEGKKDPAKIKYAHPLLEPIAGETYGILVYQEQVMEAARAVAGYTLGGADELRRAMGKKKVEEMERHRTIFVEGAAKTHNIPKAKAEEIFSVLEKFAQYGFNKSHSAAYAFLSYRTAYLKANYPVEFMTSVLAAELGNAEKVSFFVDECTNMGIQVQGPDVNKSDASFTPLPAENAIRYGVGAVKGVGEQAAKAIIQERERNGPFKDFVDFMERLGDSVNSRVVENLTKTGAFDFSGEDRRHLLDSAEGIKAYAASRSKDRASGQGSLFDLIDDAGDSMGGAANDLIVRRSDPMPSAEKLQYEKELLGFYLSGHPMNAYAGLERAINTFNGSIEEANFSKFDRTTIRLCGVASGIQKKITKEKKQTWAFFTLVTKTQNYSVNLFPEAYEKVQSDAVELLQEGRHLIVEAELVYRQERGEWSINAHRISSLEKRIPGLVKSIIFVLHPVPESEDFLETLSAELLSNNIGGGTTLRLGFRQPDGRVLQADIAASLTAHVTPEFFRKFSRHPACAGCIIETAPPAERERKWGPK